MSRRILAAVREQHIGEVICGVFVLFAIMALADAVEAPFLNKVVRFFNTHTTGFPKFEPPIYGLHIALKGFDVVLFSVLAWVSYRWFCRKTEGEPRV